MIIKTLKVKNGRNMINGQQLAHFVWNHYNPNNKWRKGFHVHHKNKDILNDHISNLELMTAKEHVSLHHSNKFISQETKKRISEGNKGNKKWLGKKHTEETKRKMAEWHLGSKLSEETKKKIGLKSLGRKHTDESKEKNRQAHLGEKNHFYGKHHSEETKIKISKGELGKKLSEETKRKMSEARRKTK